MTIVLVEAGEKTKLAKLFGVSGLTVRRALNGKTQSDLAKQIRATAVLRGGVSAHSSEERFLIRFVVRDHLRNPMRDTVCRLRFTNFLQASPYE